MKFRCPYCKHEFTDKPLATCPKCRHTMNIPGQFRKDDAAERQKAKEKIARDADRKRREMQGVFPGMSGRGRSPMSIFVIIFILLAAGALLVGRVGTVFIPEASLRPIQVAQRNVDTLRIAVELFKKDCGRYPSAEEGIKALIVNPGVEGWQRPYVDSIRPDPWKQPYAYAISNEQATVFSAGPDKLPHTADDILPDPAEVRATLEKFEAVTPAATNAP